MVRQSQSTKSLMTLMIMMIVVLLAIIVAPTTSSSTPSSLAQLLARDYEEDEYIIEEIDTKEYADDDLEASSVLYNFLPFSQRGCNGQPIGVGFGSLPFQCSPNITGTFFIMPSYNSNSYFNLSSNQADFCNEELYNVGYNTQECQNNLQATNSYYISREQWPVKIPPSSFLYQSLYDYCSKVSSYWFATNNTVITEGQTTTTYYCDGNNEPTIEVCVGTSCNVTQVARNCQNNNPQLIYCT
ncbi:hypothetical protein SAMD00019534_115070 [Acytostelium subglobosum LB1]|uniref:hypothetical protein n=1 Tax=Acytostelium subglobosum LB1 TaxID=1410327 RepID=UPI000644E1EC|nr:hypothetical protein SAMD00019534_115070 [Acytostelium subglobosum LB1]GAM28331.1 hypothetical protein SAMD00019534_115070 [Acytostelium subglobosum LB1]|eukprot:XP_012748648.1 hypothetical protein SAMD00019534_115070 [Acytostelium subglobosum LB1]